MGVTYIPGGGQQPQQQGPNTGLIQLAMAVQQMKQGQENQKKQEAFQLLDWASKDPQNALMVAPESFEKAFTTLGLKLSSAKDVQGAMDNWQSTQKDALAGGGSGPEQAGVRPPMMSAQNPSPPAVQAPPSGVQGNDLSKLGAAMQGNMAGAQAGNPPSDQAARKAPGGGSIPGGIVAPGTGALDHLVSTANQAYAQSMSGMGSLYGRAFTAQQQAHLQAQKAAELNSLAENYIQHGDMHAYGRLLGAASVMDPSLKVSPDMIHAAMLGSDDPKDRQSAMDLFRGQMSDAEVADATQKTITALGSNADFMGQLKDPRDLPAIARSVVTNGALPQGVGQAVTLRPSQLTRIADSTDKFTKLGLSPKDAYNAAQNMELGIPPNFSLGGMSIPQMEAQAKATTAGAADVSAQADKQKADIEGKKLDLEMAQNPSLTGAINNLVNAGKAGMPDSVIDELMTKASTVAGMPVEAVRHWYRFWYKTYEPLAPGIGIVPKVLGGPAAGGQADIGNGKVQSDKGTPMTFPSAQIQELSNAARDVGRRAATHGVKK